MIVTRQEIIKKLQKISEINNGKTPGEKKFYEWSEINIWNRQKYWSNYGELVREAGLKPNKFDKTKYKKSQLCKLFIKTIREKNKWPTRGELDVKHFNNRRFPNSATFYKKLGLTTELAQTILDFVGNKEEYSDVVQICKLIIIKNEDKSKIDHESKITTGFVYLGKQHGKYKIGKSKDANRRRDDISLLGSEPFILIHQIKTDDMVGIEKYWHNRFKKKWVRGEWFKLSNTDIKAFKQWKKII